MTHLTRRAPVDIDFRDIVYTVREGGRCCRRGGGEGDGTKTILKGVTGRFRSGQLSAIMGPSGAGKSTVMNVVSGYKTTGVTGDVLINGKPRDLRQFRRISCYIMQDDCLSQHLTVEEAMRVAADLKIGEKTSEEEKQAVIDEILANLGLAQTVKTTTSQLR